LRDRFGTFDEGFNEGGDHLGHEDFPGNRDFEYNLEDTDPKTGPHTASGLNNSKEHHFRDMEDVEADMQPAVDNCDPDLFQRQAHNGQDWFSHRKGLGYPDRTPAGNVLSNDKKAQVKHGVQSVLGNSPDDTTQRGPRAMWDEAQKWTQGWLDKWYKNCCKYKGEWTPKAKVPGGPECCDKEPLDAAGGLAA
jgi:hypothetical protein